MAHDIDSQQFLIANDELAFIRTHDIHLAHESEFTIPSGAFRTPGRTTRVYIDSSTVGGCGPGSRTSTSFRRITRSTSATARVPPGQRRPARRSRFRVDVVNVFDERYVIRDGSGIGVGAPQSRAAPVVVCGVPVYGSETRAE